DYSATNKSWVDEDSGRLDKNEKARLWDNFWKGGRTISYAQVASFAYTLPTNKLPLIDWTTVRASYNSTYNWLAASLLARSLGNSIANTQQKSLNAEFDFQRLYLKSRFLRALEEDAPPAQQQPPPPPPTNVTDTTAKGKKK